MRTDHVLPRYSYAHKQAAWHRADEVASVRLRYAATDWTIDDADAWLDNELLNRCPSPFVTAVVMHDRCLMRVCTGLRIEAAIDDRAWSTPWSLVPSAVLSALCRTDDRRQPPATLIMRPFGDAYGECRFVLATTLAIPARRFG